MQSLFGGNEKSNMEKKSLFQFWMELISDIQETGNTQNGVMTILSSEDWN